MPETTAPSRAALDRRYAHLCRLFAQAAADPRTKPDEWERTWRTAEAARARLLRVPEREPTPGAYKRRFSINAAGARTPKIVTGEGE